MMRNSLEYNIVHQILFFENDIKKNAFPLESIRCTVVCGYKDCVYMDKPTKIRLSL